jgi:hypothetical protein
LVDARDVSPLRAAGDRFQGLSGFFNFSRRASNFQPAADGQESASDRVSAIKAATGENFLVDSQ